METAVPYDYDQEEVPPVVQDGRAHKGDWLRYLRCRDYSQIGHMLGIKTINETTIWVHAEDISGVEVDHNKHYQAKMFVNGRTSPVFIVADVMRLMSDITEIRANKGQ